MGLDSVELLLAIEEEFGVDVPDKDAERMITVGNIFDWLKSRLAENPKECLSQRIFYRLRRALVENYGLERRAVKPDSRLIDLISESELEEGWPFLDLFIDLKTPPYKVACKLFGIKVSENHFTIRELVDALIHLHADKLEISPDSDEEIWCRLVEVFVRQLNVKPEEVFRSASITRDLGVD